MIPDTPNIKIILVSFVHWLSLSPCASPVLMRLEKRYKVPQLLEI